ncbi:uncharacterized protein LOC122009141 [Zingiber officinale]|uniref:RING-CH-type domain-containing protein n=1 Tax=Zingiber officinale TaxID=94328 RepID=A0A8J5KEG1_ZINOF|nr:uncharacterized protein LOC122009141 [Zingiber officinale]KAG6486707.1 hypothetical protein ZIOFF_055286 [Zingiber officinale]
MELKEETIFQHDSCSNKRNSCSSICDENLETSRASACSTEKDVDILMCRVCHCLEPDIRGDAALEFLNIIPPSQGLSEINNDRNSYDELPQKWTVKGSINNKSSQEDTDFIQFISPEGEILVCSADVESGSCLCHDTIIDLGCSCKNDLSHAHYACALKWFISHGSTVCEICGSLAKNVRVEDFRKVVASLKDYEELRDRTVTGEPTYINMEASSGIDPDAVAAIRRQRLSEISLWFNPHNNTASISQEAVEEVPYNPIENVVTRDTQINKSALEHSGILVVTGLLTVILFWFVAPRIGKKGAKFGFHILLGGLCVLAVVIFVRFIMPTRFKHGLTRYWAILFVFWFLAFAIWATRTHNIRAK